MDGKRYATGLMAGLLVGFLVVVAGSQGAFFGNSNAGEVPAVQFNHGPESTASFFMTTTTASSTSAPKLQGTPNASSTSTTTASQGGVQSAQTTTSVSSTVSASQTSGVSFAGELVPNPVPSSSLYSIVHQPVFSDLIVLVPLLLAFFVGAVIYRMSQSKDNE